MSNNPFSNDAVSIATSGDTSPDFVFERDSEIGKIVLHDHDPALSRHSDISFLIIALPILAVFALATITLAWLLIYYSVLWVPGC